MNDLTKETKLTILYILIAFTFSVIMRMVWIYQFQDMEAFKYAGQFMLNTNDGYYWAEGARDILNGVSQENDLSPVNAAASQLTAFFAFILPFSFESVILYIPVFLSSLIVIPIVLIARALNNLEMGLIAALLASIAWSYYNRTMVGYYDTDMLNIVLPMFLLWSIIWAIKTNENKYLIITAVDILIYRWWYPASYSLEFSFFGLILLYTLIFDKKNIYNYKLLAIMMFAMMGLNDLVRLSLVVITFYVFTQEKYEKYVYYILGTSIAVFFITGGFNPIWAKLQGYIFARELVGNEEGLKLHFFGVLQTVREAGKIPFETFANRISGHIVTFILSIVGYLFLVYRHKIMILALPMIGLGFLASVGGLRFTIYAVPILALGIGFLITEVVKYITEKKNLQYGLYFILIFAVLFPNYKHIESYKVPTVLNANEVTALNTLKEKAEREDYTIGWWDYGYPIRYYSDVKTLVDGAKHKGSVNFPVSFILSNSQQAAANMARLDVEYTEKNFELNRSISNIEQMTTDYGFNDTNDFLSSLYNKIELPEKTRDIYFYLPYNMLNIYPTVNLFSNIDLMNGQKGKRPFYMISRKFQEAGNKILLSSRVSFNKSNSSLEIGGKKAQIRRFVTTGYAKNMKFHKKIQVVNPQSNLSIIYMSAYKVFLVLDEKTYNSLYVQLMILEEYDKSLFEQVVVNPFIKIYKLKI